MFRRRATAAIVLLLATSARAADAPIHQIYLEVSALSMLYDLAATPEQIKSLESLSSDTAAKKPAGDPHPGRPYRNALIALRDAYVKNEEAAIDEAQDRFSAIEDKMDNAPDPTVEITDAARKKADAAVKLFTPAQLAEYIAARSADAPDPAATLVESLDTLRTAKNYDHARNEAAEEIAADLTGFSGKEHKSTRDVIAAFLDKAHALSDDDFKSQRPDLDAEARRLTEVADPLAVITHWVHRDLAELLSNPQLASALAARSK
jgi:hypothetical protein